MAEIFQDEVRNFLKIVTSICLGNKMLWLENEGLEI
jgi:hypothetical protein